MLWLVSDHPGIAQTDLARRLQMDRATVMAIVNRLQARDFLERGESRRDRRRQTLTLRPAGQAALADALSTAFNLMDADAITAARRGPLRLPASPCGS